MQCMNFIFLRRSWADDEAYLKRTFAYSRRIAKSDPGRTMVLLFPEGTDLSPSQLQKTNDFGAKSNKAARQYTLHPRTTGFSHFVRGLGDAIDSIVDITMGYVDYAEGERPNEKSLLSGRMPREVHVCIKRHALSELALDDASLREWCTARFEEKEVNLAAFYAARAAAAGAGAAGGDQGGDAVELDTFCGEARIAERALPRRLRPALLTAALFWATLWAFHIFAAPPLFFAAFESPTTRNALWAACVLFLCATFQMLTNSVGGIDMLELKADEESAPRDASKRR